MTEFLMVDIESLLSTWLRTFDSVTDIVDGRVWTELPTHREFPLVLITRIGGSMSNSQAHWVDRPRIQIDCYGGKKHEAKLLSSTIMALVSGELVGAHAGGVVSDVVLGIERYVPDDSEKPAKPRYLFEVTLATHPLRTGEVIS